MHWTISLSCLIDKSVPFHDPIKCSKLKTIASGEVITTKREEDPKQLAKRNIFGQLVLSSVQHEPDLQLKLSYPLGPVPWSLATADGMPVKRDKSKLLNYIESSIDPSTHHADKDVIHVVDGNAMLQSLKTVPF